MIQYDCIDRPRIVKSVSDQTLKIKDYELEIKIWLKITLISKIILISVHFVSNGWTLIFNLQPLISDAWSDMDLRKTSWCEKSLI